MRHHVALSLGLWFWPVLIFFILVVIVLVFLLSRGNTEAEVDTGTYRGRISSENIPQPGRGNFAIVSEVEQLKANPEEQSKGKHSPFL